MERNQLIEIRRLPEDHSLRLTWQDGHCADFTWDYLRGWCPCAGCQGHSGAHIRYRPTSKPVELEQIEPVGNYAVSFLWSDGHGTGIYKFSYLREICPCDACVAGRQEQA